MAPARVRGCVAHRRKVDEQLADASRRQNGPRKGAILSLDSRWCLITVRLRSKSCPANGHDGCCPRESGERRSNARHLQQAGVGSKTRSAGRVPRRLAFVHVEKEGDAA